MFGRQRDRLLREEPWTATALAQELYAMFAPDVPLEHWGQITLHQPDSGAPIVVRGFSSGDTLISARGPSGEDVIDFDPTDVDDDGGEGGGGTVASIYHGLIVSGSGNSYAVALTVTAGSPGAGETINAIWLGAINEDALSPGRPVIVVRAVDLNYYIIAPAVPQCFIATVTSGSGQTYSVSGYPNGLSEAPITISGAKDSEVDATEQVPTGTYVVVVRSADGEHHMRFPTFFE